MLRGIKKSLIALSISGVVAAPSAFATNGYFAHGYSTKEKGLAGAGVAFSQDAMAIATNPAGIAFLGERMDIGLALFSPIRSYTTSGTPLASNNQLIDNFCASGPGSFNPSSPGFGLTGPCQPPFALGPVDGGTVDSENELFLIPHFAYNWKLDENSAFAVAVYGNGGMNTEYKTSNAGNARLLDQDPSSPTGFTIQEFPGTYGGGKAGVNLMQLFINLSYAQKINKNSSWGAGVILAHQRFKATGLSQFAGFSTDPSNLSGGGQGHDTSNGFGVKLGWQGEVAKGFSLGASYQSKVFMTEFDDYAGLFAEDGDFDIPATMTLGLAWDTSDKSKLVLDIQQIYYSEVASIANPMSRLTSEGICADPLNAALGGANPMPTTGTGPGCLGGSNGVGFGWDDMTIVKLGYQWLVDDLTWRVGVSHGESPIDESEVLFNVLAPAVVETHLTFGLTVPLGADAEFSFAGMYALNNSVKGPNPFDTNPNAPGAGTQVEIEMDQFEVQGTYSMKF